MEKDNEIIYAIGDSSFESVRSRGAVYVDKTDLVYRLVTRGKCYFLSRPRRFGKSLLLSTLEAYFLGRKDLFGGLAIEQLEKEWNAYPVLHLDFMERKYVKDEALLWQLQKQLERWENEYGIAVKNGLDLEGRFGDVILAAEERHGRPAVVLIDEYDKPLLDALGNDTLEERNRTLLASFYGVLKSQMAHLRFVLLTGVTRFSHVSIFSGLNNLQDISMDTRYDALCGITQAELQANLGEGVRRLAEGNGQTTAEAYGKLEAMYDGYRFSPRAEEGVYNPFSLLLALDRREYGKFWFSTGTPTYLVQAMQRSGFWVDDLTGVEVSTDELDSINNPYQNPRALFYQAGYLTLGERSPGNGKFKLRFPNEEVEAGFKLFLRECYIPGVFGNATYSVEAFRSCLAAGDAERFMELLAGMFRTGSYAVIGELERYYQVALRVFFEMLGARVEVEHCTANGRIDLLAWVPQYVFLFELKMGEGAAAAARQIVAKGYAQGVDARGRRVIAIGVSFSREGRGISGWKIVES